MMMILYKYTAVAAVSSLGGAKTALASSRAASARVLVVDALVVDGAHLRDELGREERPTWHDLQILFFAFHVRQHPPS